MVEKRPTLTLKPVIDVLSSDDDMRVDLYTFDLLLPCRRYEINYKIALLGNISPTLEFLLRLVKTVDGLEEDEARTFFGFSRTEMEYVISEATTPGYVDRIESRLWLTVAGDALFSEGGSQPAIFKVESRSKQFGFDQLSLSPERRMPLDRLEMLLPDLSTDSPFGGGAPSKVVGERFRQFFRELGDREERRSKRRNLYSIDSVVPAERYQVPIRLNVYCQASSPTLPEVDLSSWRPEQELSDRPQVEKAIGEFVSALSLTVQEDQSAYEMLMEFAPDFFKEYRTGRGFAAARYWRYAITHQGDTRLDRQTIPIAGSLTTRSNLDKVFRLIDSRVRESGQPSVILSIPCQRKNWGATTLLREANISIKQKLLIETEDENASPETICLVPGRPQKYLAEAFDVAAGIDYHEIPQSIELYVIPSVAVVVLAHTPVGAPIGIPVPLGFASLDAAVVRRVEEAVLDKVVRFIDRDHLRSRIEIALAPSPQVALDE